MSSWPISVPMNRFLRPKNAFSYVLSCRGIHIKKHDFPIVGPCFVTVVLASHLFCTFPASCRISRNSALNCRILSIFERFCLIFWLKMGIPDPFGKDEVASSNLAISLRMPAEMQVFSLLFGQRSRVDIQSCFFHFLYPPESKSGKINGKNRQFFDFPHYII